MKILLSHPTGNANVRSVLKGLVNAGMLESFYTSLACYPNSILDSLSRLSVFSELQRRKFDPALEPYTYIHSLKEVGRVLSSKFGIKSLIRHETGFFSIDAVYEYAGRKAAISLSKKKNIDAVYAYEDGALSLFKQAKKMGIECIYDLPIAYWETGRRLMLDEAQRLPDWAPTLAGGIKDSQAKLDRKREELALADVIVVASKFVKDSLPDNAASKKIIFSPFGSPKTSLISTRERDNTKPLRVLFAGSMGQRKGLGDLFKAIKLLKSINIQLVVMGSLLAPMKFYEDQIGDFIYEPPRPHSEVLALMRTCDVFCLPSIVEGRALVMQEAMSEGLPIVITRNTGGEDLVIDGKTGFLVPISSPEAIAEKLEWFANNRSELEAMSQYSKEHAMNYTWERYAETIISGILE